MSRVILGRSVAVSLVVATLAGTATAGPPTLAERFPAGEKKEFGGMVDGRLGFGMLDEDFFVSINVGTVLTWWKLGVGIQVPLRFRAVDNAPEQGTVLREEDWDEASDWTRVLRFVSWGTPDEWLYARLGVLEGTTLGHGSIVDRYMNVIDADHYQTGLQFKLDLDLAGGELFLDNLIDPEIFGMRGFFRPFQMWDAAPELSKTLELGITMVVDGVAPLEYTRQSTLGTCAGGVQCPLRQVTEDGDVITSASQAFLFGFDLSWTWRPIDWFALRPYYDFGLLGQTGGTGNHLGVSATFDVKGAVTIGTRVEYRAISEDYAPSYVNSWYEVERVDFAENPAPKGIDFDRVTKLDYFKRKDELGEEDTVHGWHASLDVTILDTVTVWALLEDVQGPDNANLTIGLSLPYIAGVRAQVYYAKRNFDEPAEAFDLDRGLLVADARYKFWGPMFVYAAYSREWKVNKDATSEDFGQYETLNDWDLGVGAEFTF